MYRDLPTAEEKADFFAEHGVRWTEFARLDYFDLVRHTVIDPMHNLLLGKTPLCLICYEHPFTCVFDSRCREKPVVYPMDRNWDSASEYT